MRRQVCIVIAACALYLSAGSLFAAQKNGNHPVVPVTTIDEQNPFRLVAIPTDQINRAGVPGSHLIDNLRPENFQLLWFSAVKLTLVQPTAATVNFTVTNCAGDLVAQGPISYLAGRSCRQVYAIVALPAAQATTLRWRATLGAFDETTITGDDGVSPGACAGASTATQANGDKSNGTASNLSRSGGEVLGGLSTLMPAGDDLFMSAVAVDVTTPSAVTVNAEVRDCFNRLVAQGPVSLGPGNAGRTTTIQLGPSVRRPVTAEPDFLPNQPLTWTVTADTDRLQTTTADDGRSPGTCDSLECYQEFAAGGQDVAETSTATIEVEVQPGKFFEVQLQGPVLIRRLPVPPPQGQRPGRCEIQTQMVQLNLTGQSPVGPVRVSLQPGRPSNGLIVQQRTGVNFPANSFFDVFARIDMPNHPDPRLRATINREATRLEAQICDIPPRTACDSVKGADSNSAQVPGGGPIPYCNQTVALSVRCRVFFCRLDDPNPPCNAVRRHCHNPRF